MTDLGRRLIKAAKEGVAIARNEQDPATYRVHIPDDIDVKTIRENFKLTQSGFAARFAIPEATLRDWEQHRRKPSGMARLFLLLLAREPAAVRRVLASLVHGRSGGRRGERRQRPAALAGGHRLASRPTGSRLRGAWRWLRATGCRGRQPRVHPASRRRDGRVAARGAHSRPGGELMTYVPWLRPGDVLMRRRGLITMLSGAAATCPLVPPSRAPHWRSR